MKTFERKQKRFLKVVLSMLMLVSLFSCEKEDMNNVRRRIVKVVGESSDQFTKYTYLPDGKLAQIISYSRNEAFQREIMKYNSLGQIIERVSKYEKSGRISYIDSFFYDNKGRLDGIKGYSILFTPHLSLISQDSFDHYENGKIHRNFSYFYSPGGHRSLDLTIYKWEGDNVIHSVSYNDKGAIHAEYSYMYDDKPNYQYNHPIFLYDPRSLSKNNVIRSVFDGHGLSYSTPCHDCTYEYTYDEFGYPISRFLKGDGIFYMEYESY